MPAVGGVLTHTNHFLMPIGEAADLALRDWPDSIARLASLGELANGDAPVDGKQVKEALRSHTAQPLAVCLHDPDNPQYENRQQTLASVVMHLDDRRIELAPGPPCAIAYVAIPPH
jgi:isopenicillin-N N-acyltransferase-like protein